MFLSWIRSRLGGRQRRSFARIGARHGYFPAVESLEARDVPTGFLVAATDAGASAGWVNVYADYTNDARNERQTSSFRPFGDFNGGIRVATGDFDGDGNDELVTAAGPGGEPWVAIYDIEPGRTVGRRLDAWLVFGRSFRGGTFVSTGDLDGDGRDELFTSADAGGGPFVNIWSDVDQNGTLRDNLIDTFQAFGSSWTGGIRTAAGDTDNDGDDELIAAPGPGGEPWVLVYDDRNEDRKLSNDPRRDDQFLAFGQTFRGGLYVAAGPTDGTATPAAEVIVGAGAGGEPWVNIFTGIDTNGNTGDPFVVDRFLAYGRNFTGGVRVASADYNLTGSLHEVVTGPGPSGAPHINVFWDDPTDTGDLYSDNAVYEHGLVFSTSYLDGVFVAHGQYTLAAFGADFDLAIPDNGQAAGLRAIIQIPDLGIWIKDLDVFLNIRHTHNADLDVTLSHVFTSGGIQFDNQITLFTDVGGSGDGFRVILNDEAVFGIASAASASPVEGEWQPEGPGRLSEFDNEYLSAGNWVLNVRDDSQADVGSLLRMELLVRF